MDRDPQPGQLVRGREDVRPLRRAAEGDDRIVLTQEQRLGAAARGEILSQPLLQVDRRGERDAPQPAIGDLSQARAYPSASSAKKSASTKSTLIIALTTPTPWRRQVSAMA
jgi:hypothetical protein